MKQEIISFDLKSDFAFFKNKEDKENNSSYLSIYPAAILGLLGSVLGYKGFKDFNKENKLEYLEKLNDIKINIEIINDSFKLVEVGYNDATKLDIGKKMGGNTFQYREECLIDVHYRIRLLLDDKNKIHQELKEKILNKETVYTQYLGRSQFITAIENVEIEEFDTDGTAEYFQGIHNKEYTFHEKNIADAFISDFNDYKYSNKIFFQIPISIKYNENFGVVYNRYELVSYNGHIEDYESIVLNKNDKILFKDKKGYQFYGN